MNKDARFYFANLGADVSRCISAAEKGDEARFEDSIKRAHRTLAFLRATQRPEAYEEGLLLLRGLSYAKTDNTLPQFSTQLSALIGQYSPLIQ